MITIKNSYLAYLATLLISGVSYADGFSKKEVYSYQSNTGTPVFTDKRPIKNKQYNTQTIETVNPDSSRQTSSSYKIADNTKPIIINQTQTVVYSNKNSSKKKRGSKRKTKDSLKLCQRYKEKVDYYSEKMRGGYRSSEYKKLEKNRKKYKNLLFNRCDTKTFKE